MQMTKRLEKFVADVTAIAVAIDDVFTPDERRKEYTAQILEDDFDTVCTYAFYAGVKIPRALSHFKKLWD